MSRYSKNASENRRDIKLLREEITEYELENKRGIPEEIRDKLIELKSQLVLTEVRLNNDLRGMYREGIDTYDELERLQRTMLKDITSFQDDLITKRGNYMEWHQKEMERKYPGPLNRAARREQIKDSANYQYELFQNTRLTLTLQCRKLSYCKCMSDSDRDIARRLQTKLRTMYENDFNSLFRHTVNALNLVGIEDAKDLLEIRKTIIEQAQDEDLKKEIIIERPLELQKICDRRNSVLNYKRGIEGEIRVYKEIIQFDAEVRAAEKAYYESGKFEEDQERARQEEEQRYAPGWVIPDEEYMDEEGNIIRSKTYDSEQESEDIVEIKSGKKEKKATTNKSTKTIGANKADAVEKPRRPDFVYTKTPEEKENKKTETNIGNKELDKERER